MYSNGFYNIVIYTDTINTSLECNYVDDGDAIDLNTLKIIYSSKIKVFFLNICYKKYNFFKYCSSNNLVK